MCNGDRELEFLNESLAGHFRCKAARVLWQLFIMTTSLPIVADCWRLSDGKVARSRGRPPRRSDVVGLITQTRVRRRHNRWLLSACDCECRISDWEERRKEGKRERGKEGGSDGRRKMSSSALEKLRAGKLAHFLQNS